MLLSLTVTTARTQWAQPSSSARVLHRCTYIFSSLQRINIVTCTPVLSRSVQYAASTVTHATMEQHAAGQQPRVVQPGAKELDFTSADFEPLAALQTPGLQPPVPEAPVLDNVSRCAALVPPEPSQQSHAMSHAVSEEDKARLEQELQAKKAKAAALKQRAQRTAQRAEASVKTQSLAAIMSAAAKGPLEALAKWQSSGQRVLVITRHAAGVRGRAVGTLVAFDRFMNLILADVEENYTVIIKVPRVKQQQQLAPQQSVQGSILSQAALNQPLPRSQQQLDQQQQQQQQIAEIMGLQTNQQQTSAESHTQQQQGAVSRTRTRWCRKQEHRFRRLSQVLLKGDSIVLISGQPP